LRFHRHHATPCLLCVFTVLTLRFRIWTVSVSIFGPILFTHLDRFRFHVWQNRPISQPRQDVFTPFNQLPRLWLRSSWETLRLARTLLLVSRPRTQTSR
jgi:hypothetical protein